MKPDLKDLEEISRKTGFLTETVEKVVRLAQILTEIQSHPFLSGKLVLKGGTAIHLFWLQGKRLSVDLDLNYIGYVDRKEMMAEKPKLEEAIERLCNALGYSMLRIPIEHAGGKWRLGYQGCYGQSQVLELDINYLYRIPIWGTEQRSFHAPGLESIQCTFPLVHPLELWAGKIAAALLRAEPRDLFDLLYIPKMVAKSKNLKRTIILIGSGQRGDWRKVSPDIFYELTPDQIHKRLAPVLNTQQKINWTGLVRKAHLFVKPFLRLREKEKLYLNLLEDQGKYHPEILFREQEMSQRLGRHPVLLWKAQNRHQFLSKTSTKK